MQQGGKAVNLTGEKNEHDLQNAAWFAHRHGFAFASAGNDYQEGAGKCAGFAPADAAPRS